MSVPDVWLTTRITYNERLGIVGRLAGKGSLTRRFSVLRFSHTVVSSRNESKTRLTTDASPEVWKPGVVAMKPCKNRMSTVDQMAGFRRVYRSPTVLPSVRVPSGADHLLEASLCRSQYYENRRVSILIHKHT